MSEPEQKLTRADTERDETLGETDLGLERLSSSTTPYSPSP